MGTITVLDYEFGHVHVIHLSEEEEKLLEECSCIEEFFDETFDKYRIDASNCHWMYSRDLKIYNYKDNKKSVVTLLIMIKNLYRVTYLGNGSGGEYYACSDLNELQGLINYGYSTIELLGKVLTNEK